MQINTRVLVRRSIQQSLLWLLLGMYAAVSHSAVMLDPAGRGQVLIFPYYTVNEGEQTLLSIVNPSYQGKAVKLRFRESLNGREVLALNVYLDGYDTWTAALIAATEDAPAWLLTRDSTCTVPRINGSTSLPQLSDGTPYASFSTAELTDGASDAPTRTRVGYFEAIEMGTIVGGSDTDVAMTHVDGAPKDCAALVAAWDTGGYWSADPNTDLQPPSGGLQGGASIIHTALGTAYNVGPTAISGFSVITQHTAPSAALPDLSSSVTQIDRSLVESVHVIDGKVYRSEWPVERAIDAVSALLMRASVRNQYDVSIAIRAQSDWMTTMPTKRHYADPLLNGGSAIAPFTASFTATSSACERINLMAYDREERRPVGLISFITIPEDYDCLCHSTAQVAFNRSLSTPPFPNVACRFRNISTSFGSSGVFQHGYLNMDLSGNGHILRPDLSGKRYLGLPAIGFWKLRYQDAAAPHGQIRYYTESKVHRGLQICAQTNNQACEAL